MRHIFLVFSSALAVAAGGGCTGALDVGSNEKGGPDVTSSGGTTLPGSPESTAAQCPAVTDSSDALLVAEPGRFIEGLVVDAGDVFYASSPSSGMGESVLTRVSISGGAPVEIARTPRPMSLVSSGEWLYVTPAGNGHYELLRVKKSGGPVETLPLDAGEAPTHAVSDGAGGVVYAGLRTKPGVAPLVHVAASGARTKLAEDMPTSVIADAMATSGDAIFWAPEPFTPAGSADGVLYATAHAGGASRTLYGPDPGRPVYAVALDDKNVYFARSGGIARASRDGGATTTLAADPGNPLTLLVEGTSLYYLTAGTYDAASNLMKHARVGRIATETGKDETLRTELTLPARLALGRCALVFSTNEEGRSAVYRRAK